MSSWLNLGARRLLIVTDEDRVALESLARRHTTGQAVAMRARIILESADGAPNKRVAARLGIWPQTVTKWRNRFIDKGVAGLVDEDRPGRPRTVTDEQVEDVVVHTLEERPPDGGTHWSTRAMARRTGMSQSTVSRIWRAFELKPHLVDSWKLSTDPFFIDKVKDVVGLYLNLPEGALVLCIDEKSQIQALDRTAPVLPLMPGVPERQTHDYVRAGTTTLFAALDVATGKVIHAMHRQHRAVEFRKFLNKIDREVPAEFDVRLVCDNYGTHKAPIVKKWLLATPASTCTTPDLLQLAQHRRTLVRGDHPAHDPPRYPLHVADLEHALRAWIEQWNADPKPFIWTKTADEILETAASYLHRINDSEH